VMFSLKASNASLSCGKQLAFRLSCRGGSPCDATDKKLEAAATIRSKNLAAEGCIVSGVVCACSTWQ
jgi:hypothetical protein